MMKTTFQNLIRLVDSNRYYLGYVLFLINLHTELSKDIVLFNTSLPI